MCPWGRTTILLAAPSGQGPCWLCVPYSWPWLTRQALLREPAGRHVSPGQRRWPQQATGGCRLGHAVTQAPSCARPAPSRGTRSYPVSPWPQWLTSSASARAATAPKALPPRSSFCIQQVFPCSHDAARSRGRWGSADAALGEGLQALSTLSAFSTQICVETCKGCRAQPAC